jgi:hypothetical protein
VKSRAALLLLVLATAACQRAPEPPPPPPAPPAKTATEDETVPVAAAVEDIDGDNLLNIAYGAAVVSRTAELNLENSAVQAIDGLSFSLWTSSPGGPQQTLVFSLGGPSRIERLGVTTSAKNQSPAHVRFEASSDAHKWREIVTMEPADRKTELVDVPPFDARYLRVTTIEPSEYYASFFSVHAIGRETGPAERRSFDGCWSINTHRTTLVQHGARITGVINGPKPTFIDGGVDGRVAKLLWMRGPMWGYAAATLTPDGRGLSAIQFHEEPHLNRNGEGWIGHRCNDTFAMSALPSPADYFRRIGHWTMSGLVFDADEHLLDEPSKATLDDAAKLIAAMPSQRFRIVAREFRNNDAKDNLRRTTARIEAVRNALRTRGVDLARIELVASGSETIGVEMPSAVQRLLFSRIDLEPAVVRPAS